MYLLRDADDYDFLKSIDNIEIKHTENLNSAITCSSLEEAKALKQYIKLVQGDDYFDIVEVEFKEVE